MDGRMEDGFSGEGWFETRLSGPVGSWDRTAEHSDAVGRLHHTDERCQTTHSPSAAVALLNPPCWISSTSAHRKCLSKLDSDLVNRENRNTESD